MTDLPLSSEEDRLAKAIAAIIPAGIIVACRQIRNGDENLLYPAERSTIHSKVLGNLRASGAARHAARQILSQYGIDQTPILRAVSGEPIWPQGLIGSIAHDDYFAVAALADGKSFRAIGIDVEPALPLPVDLLDFVVSNSDRLTGLKPDLAGRIVFCLKEAVYKASFPLDREILDYDDIAVDALTGTAKLVNGRIFSLFYCTKPHVFTLAIECAA